MIRRNISLTEKDYYEDLASIERTQIQQVTEFYNNSIKVVKAQRVSLLKGALGGGNITLPNGEINTAALQQALLGKGLNQTDVHEILEQIQTLDLDYSNKVTKAASKAARDDNFNIGQAVNEFQNLYNTEIAGFIDNIKAGILRRKTKDELDVKTSGDKGESGKETKEEPKEPSIVKDHKDLIEDPIKFKEEQTKIISEDFKASTGEQAKQQLNKPVYTLSDEDTKYYSELTKNLPPEVIAQKFAHSTANLPVVQERTLTGMDVFDLVTTGKLTESPKKPVLKKSKTGLGPVVDEIDEAVGAVVNWFKDKPQTKHEVESTVSFLELFNKGEDKIKSSFSEFQSNRAKAKGKETTERLLRTPERTPMESTPPIPMKEVVVQDKKPPTVTPNKAYIEAQKQKNKTTSAKQIAVKPKEAKGFKAPEPKKTAGPKKVTESKKIAKKDSNFYSTKYNIDKNLFEALLIEESGKKQSAVSGRLVKGIAQVTQVTGDEMFEGTGRTFNVDSEQDQLEAGAKYYAKQIKDWTKKGFDKQQVIRLASASYNAGYDRINQAIQATNKSKPTMEEISKAGNKIFSAESFAGKSFREGMKHWKKIEKTKNKLDLKLK